MTRWLVTGAGGMLGRELHTTLTEAGIAALPLARADLDLTDERAVRCALRRARPAVVVNCAAWTDVDGAERDEAAAARINADGTRLLARACAASGARLLHLSTDYVFSGEPGPGGPAPYPEDAPPGPRTAYGRTKLAGERAVLAELPTSGAVVRTAWLYGQHGRNFVRTMADRALAPGGGTVSVVDDQHGQPTWTRDVARHLLALGRAPTPASGVFHSTSAGRTTWYGLAREVFRLCGADPGRVRPLDSAALDRPAPRPAWSVLAHGRRDTPPGQPPPRDWRAALAEALPFVVPEAPRPAGALTGHPSTGEHTRCTH
ncbi:dTDP-4-dehydrorhamnose reductase [Streptomyces cacaoi]|uniref:dTDP-4-dehydrorhamnose reductase n=1 Tax=Streptomyces cacaoi TaxID=1898 RepID=UPI0011F25EEC|nr:dTDP-4-dehydrorhamnose reductase [Streptomyces cacaoi]